MEREGERGRERGEGGREGGRKGGREGGREKVKVFLLLLTCPLVIVIFRTIV